MDLIYLLIAFSGGATAGVLITAALVANSRANERDKIDEIKDELKEETLRADLLAKANEQLQDEKNKLFIEVDALKARYVRTGYKLGSINRSSKMSVDKKGKLRG